MVVCTLGQVANEDSGHREITAMPLQRSIALIATLLLWGCQHLVYGVPLELWQGMTEAEHLAAMEAYTARQQASYAVAEAERLEEERKHAEAFADYGPIDHLLLGLFQSGTKYRHDYGYGYDYGYDHRYGNDYRYSYDYGYHGGAGQASRPQAANRSAGSSQLAAPQRAGREESRSQKNRERGKSLSHKGRGRERVEADDEERGHEN